MRLTLIALVLCSALGAAVSYPVGDPEKLGFDLARLDAMRDTLAKRGTKHLLIVKDGQIALEWYEKGRNAQTKHYTASLAKALVGGTSLLLAMADGRIRPDTRVSTYIPEWANDPLKSKITIRHLATHTSGLQDAKSGLTPHEKLPGWMGQFWRREPDPFSLTLRDVPVIFEPGTRYHYSNTGMAALAYAVTASLREAPQKDIRSLLRERVMKPLGISEDEYSIGYGRAYKVNGLDLYANWGGANFTSRAVARVGEMMMNGGKPVLPERVVEAGLKYMGTALPERRDESARTPASGLCWYTNFDGVWPALPRDAFAGAGAGQQILLVVPSLKLIVVRNGSETQGNNDGQFWAPVYENIFAPVMDALGSPVEPLKAPYPQSPVITGVKFAPEAEIVRKAPGSDNWPITWGADDHQYTSYGDGWGFEPLIEKKLSIGMARVEGGPSDFRGINVRSNIEAPGDGKAGPKASGILSVGAVLYMWNRNVGNAQLVWSADNGVTWEKGFKFEESFGSPSFLNFGRDYAGARDNFVYTYSQDGPSAYESDNGLILARVPKNRIRERAAWEFFAGLNVKGQPVWSKDIRARKQTFVFPGNCQRTDAVYNPGVKRYLIALGYGHHGGWGIFDAPEPWGPWTTVFHTDYWELGGTHGYRLPSKWISKDGKTMTLVFSGVVYDNVSYDAFCTRRMTLETK